MKHNVKITIILLVMFLVTQLIGLAVISHYQAEDQKLPLGLEPPEVTQESAWSFLRSIVVAFVIAIFLVFVLMNLKSVWFMKTWFFIVIIIALSITLYALLTRLDIPNAIYITVIIALILAYFKVFKRDMIVHNLTELMIYPGIAAVFVPILNIWTIIILLVLISAYDIWAVWHSKVMQKMAKFQIKKLKVFSGFFIPYASKKEKKKIKLLKDRYKGKDIPESVIKRRKIKVNLAILGGGDVIFPIIAAGVFMKTFNLFSAVFVVLGATLALLYLFVFSKKRRYYPAMPFLTAGIFLGMLAGWFTQLIL